MYLQVHICSIAVLAFWEGEDGRPSNKTYSDSEWRMLQILDQSLPWSKVSSASLSSLYLHYERKQSLISVRPPSAALEDEN